MTLTTLVVWVLLAMSVDPLKAECTHQRVVAAYENKERCETSAKAMRNSGSDTVWECEEVQLIK